MSAPTLRSYFETADRQRLALDAVVKGRWLDPSGNLDLYDASRRAFDPTSAADEALREFEKIYNELQGNNWNVFRSPRPSVGRWPPQRVFETIKREFPEFSWGGPVNLLNFSVSGTETHLGSCLTKMRGIKQKSGYPHMTVSKFLHFYNPGLFPIYDTAMIWEQVIACFENEFRDFCGSEYDYRNDGTETFLIYYMRWASSLLSAADETFMQVFRGWMDEQPGTELHRRGFGPTTLYATAFEFTAIGAMGATRNPRGVKPTDAPAHPVAANRRAHATYRLEVNGQPVNMDGVPESNVIELGRCLRAAMPTGTRVEYRCVQMDLGGKPYRSWPCPMPRNATALLPRGRALAERYGLP